MLSRSVHWSVASAIAMLMAACSSMQRASGEVAYTRSIALPVELATAVLAGAVRAALPFADPLPNATGAPASRLGDDCFQITFEQNADGLWTPNATHRLTVATSSEHAPLPDVHVEVLAGRYRLLPLGARAKARIQLTIRGSATGSLVAGSLPSSLADSLRQALDRTAVFAVDPATVALGLSEPNLAALAAHRLLAQALAAMNASQPQAGRSLLQQVELLGIHSPRLHERLGELAAQMGEHALAREQLWQAALSTDDPTTRQYLAQRVAAVEVAAIARAPLRRAARDRLAAFDMAAAETLLHTARRRWPQPAEDYLLQSQVHRERDNDMVRHACSLLAREYETDSAGRMAWTYSLLPASLQELAHRFTRGTEPALAGAVSEPGRTLPAAAPAR
ncbi:MAG: hypothetical protein ABIP94_12770 [Planctomycetota bacterium]